MPSLVRLLRFFEKASDAAPAVGHTFDNLVLVEGKDRLQFTAEPVPAWTRRFLFWFRWLFLAGTIAMAVQLYQNMKQTGHWAEVLVLWICIVVVLSIGIVGAFLVGPAMSSAFRVIESMTAKSSSKLPSFDLRSRTVRPPDSTHDYPFDDIVGIEAAEGGTKLVMVLRDHSSVFLLNIPVSKARQMATMLNRVSELTSIRIQY